MFLRYKVCVTLFTERDDGRYVNVPATGRDDDRYVTILHLHETTIVLSQEMTASFQIISAKLKCSVKCDANKTLFEFHTVLLFELHPLFDCFHVAQVERLNFDVN